ncbi:MAG: hypothetical protein JO144_06615 [Actinobacteria bacterium]|nr:hypothetical protein [Actinomycetota bacterium]
MIRRNSRVIGTTAAVLVLAASGFVWTSSSADATGQCGITVSADHYTASATCPAQPNGWQFRVKTYACTSMYSGCGSTPVYGDLAPWNGTSSVNLYPYYVDTSRISVEYDNV